MNRNDLVVRCKPVIVHLLASPFFGGPERQVLGLARQLRDSYRSIFMSFSERGLAEPLMEHARDAGFKTITLANNAPHFVACVREISRQLLALKADLLCCHGYKPDLIGLAAVRWSGIPIISISRGWTGATLKVRLNEAADRLSLHGMDRVVCVSEGQARKVRKCCIPAQRIQVIHNAIDTRRFSCPAMRDRSELLSFFPQPVSEIVLAAGRLSPEKGFADLIDAASVAMNRCDNVGFIVFGDGPLLDSLARRVTARQLQDRFVLAGFHSDVDRYIPHADLVVIPSYTEGLPNIALEAHAASVPVVATAVGGTPEVVQAGVTGRLVPAGDFRGLAQNIHELLKDAALRRDMGARALERVQSQFGFKAQGDKYHALFEQLISRAHDRGRTQRAILTST
jgi:glycosyltransferase involved in cell wall biosynthesis